MSSNKEVKVTIDVGAKFKGREQINESVQAVQALANVTGLTGKQISKMHKGLMSLEDAYKILAHLNNTMGLSSTQIKLFAQAIGKSSAEVQDFLNNNNNLTKEYERQCKRIKRLESLTTNLSAKHKEQEKSLASLRKEYTKLGGDAEHAAEWVTKYTDGQLRLKEIEKLKKSLSQEYNQIRSGNEAVNKVWDTSKDNRAKRDELRLQRDSLIDKRNDSEVSKILNPTLGVQYDEAITQYTAEIDRLDAEIQELQKDIDAVSAEAYKLFTPEETTHMNEITEQVKSLSAEYEKLNTPLSENTNDLLRVGEQIRQLEEGQKRYEEHIEKWNGKLKESTGAINEQGHAASTAASLIGEYVKEVHNNIIAQTELKEAIDNADSSIDNTKSSVEGFKSSTGELKSTEDNLSKSTGETQYELAMLGQSANYVGKQIYSMSSVLDFLAGSADNANSILNNLNFDVDKYNEALSKIDTSLKVSDGSGLSNPDISSKVDQLYVMDNVISSLTGSISNFDSTLSSTKHNAEGFSEIVAKTGDYASSSYSVLIESLNGAPQAFSNVSTSAGDLQHNLANLNNAESKLKWSIDDLNNTINKTSWSLPELDENLDSSSKSLSDTGKSANKTSEYMKQLERRLDEFNWNTQYTHKSTNELNKSSSKLDKSTSNLGNSMLEAAIKYKLLTKALDIGKKLYQECTKTLEDVGRVAINTGESLVNGFGQAIETAEKLIDIADKACSKIKELADAGSDLQAGWFKLYNYLGEEGGNTYLDYLNDLHDVLSVDADDIVQNAEGVLSMVDNLGLSLEKSTEAMEAFTHFGLDLSTFSGEGFGEIVGQLENAVNLNVLNSRSALAHALNLTNKDVEVFKSFNSEQERANYLLSRGGEFRDNYKKWLQTAGGKIAQLNSSVSSLTGNIQKLSTGLLAKLAPAITSIVKLLDKLVSMLYKVFNIKDLTSAEGNMAKGFDGVVGDAESATEALDDTTEAAKKLERQVAGFDDVIQINDSSSSSSKDIKDTVNGLMGDIDFSDWLEDLTPNPSAFEKKLDKIYDLIEQGKWSEVGNKIRDSIVNGLNSIDWSKVKNKLAKFTRGLSNLLNGLLKDGKLAGSIGTSLSQLINTVVAGINAFLGNKELFKNLGISLSKGINSFFKTLDAEGIANMLSSFVHDVFTTFSNFVDTMNKDGTWSLIGTKISAIINGFFSSFTIEDIQSSVDSIISFINGVFEMIGTFIDNLDTEDIKNKITTFVRGLFEGFKEHQDDWAATLSEFTSFVVDLLSSLVETWDSTGMTNAVIKFLQDSGIYEMVWELTKLKLHMLFQGILIKIASVGPMLQETVGTIIALIIARISIGIAVILGLGERIKTGIKTLGTWLKVGLSEIWDWVKDLFSNIFDWVGDWVSKLWDKVSGFFESLKDKILGVDETVSSAKSYSSSGGGYYRNEDGFISRYSDEGIEVPLLANGGIVHRATLATIGEAGTEAVVPLQNNTEWMDTMAKSLVSAMDNKNNGMAGSTVVIDMSKCSKQVYTRSELQAFGKLVADSLNTYGANVAYNY